MQDGTQDEKASTSTGIYTDEPLDSQSFRINIKPEVTQMEKSRLAMVKKFSVTLATLLSTMLLLEHLTFEKCNCDNRINTFVNSIREQLLNSMIAEIQKLWRNFGSNLRTQNGKYVKGCRNKDWYNGWVGKLEKSARCCMLASKLEPGESQFDLNKFDKQFRKRLAVLNEAQSGKVFCLDSFNETLEQTMHHTFPSIYTTKTCTDENCKPCRQGSKLSKHQRNYRELKFLIALTGQNATISNSEVFMGIISSCFFYAMTGLALGAMIISPAHFAPIAIISNVSRPVQGKSVKSDESSRAQEANEKLFGLISLLYVDQFQECPEKVRQAIIEIDSLIWRKIQERNPNWLTMLERRQTILLCLREKYPVIPLQLPAGLQNAKEKNRIENMDHSQINFIAQYISKKTENNEEDRTAMAKEIAWRLWQKISEIRIASTNEYQQRIILHIWGEPGVGKTRFVKKLSELLGLPLRIIYNTSQQDTRRLHPTQSLISNEAWASEEVSGEDLLTSIPWAILQEECANTIIFVDEAKGLIQENGRRYVSEDGNKIFLDPDHREFPLKCLNMDFKIDVSQSILIFATNEPLYLLTTSSGIHSRTDSVEFPSLTSSQKTAALRPHIEAQSNASLFSHQREEARQILYDLSTVIPAYSREAGVRSLIILLTSKLWAPIVSAYITLNQHEQYTIGSSRFIELPLLLRATGGESWRALKKILFDLTVIHLRIDQDDQRVSLQLDLENLWGSWNV